MLHYDVSTTATHTHELLDFASFTRRETADSYARVMNGKYTQLNTPARVVVAPCSRRCEIFPGN